VFRILVDHGTEGAPAGILSEKLGIPPKYPVVSPLSHEDILACLGFASEKEHRSAWVFV